MVRQVEREKSQTFLLCTRYVCVCVCLIVTCNLRRTLIIVTMDMTRLLRKGELAHSSPSPYPLPPPPRPPSPPPLPLVMLVSDSLALATLSWSTIHTDANLFQRKLIVKDVPFYLSSPDMSGLGWYLVITEWAFIYSSAFISNSSSIHVMIARKWKCIAPSLFPSLIFLSLASCWRVTSRRVKRREWRGDFSCH